MKATQDEQFLFSTGLVKRLRYQSLFDSNASALMPALDCLQVSVPKFPILVEHLIDRDVPEVKAWTKSIEKIMCEVGPAGLISREGFVRAL